MTNTIYVALIGNLYLNHNSIFTYFKPTHKPILHLYETNTLQCCTSQQKVDITLYFYTSFNEHNTPYTVLESDNSESMPDVLH